MTSDVQAARERLKGELADYYGDLPAHALSPFRVGDVRTILSALTAAEERAATAERERDEARALATERLEALRPFAAVFHGRHMKDDPPPTLVGLLVGVTARHMAAGDLDGLSCDHFRRAAALTSGADHGG